MELNQLYEAYKQHPTIFTDSRLAKNGGLFFALKGDRFDGNQFALQALADGAHFAIVDDANLTNEQRCIYVPDVLAALQQLANYHRLQLQIPIIGITGTNGKTTTKELIHAVLSQKFNTLATQGNLNNHIGVPLTLLSINAQHEIAIIEMGANHLGEIAQLCAIAEPDYGIITNVGKAHLEGFGSFEGVKKTKGELYQFIQQKGKGIFINTGNPHLVEMANRNNIQYSYSTENADLVGEVASDHLHLTAKVRFARGWLYLKSNLSGAYNLENILAATRIGLHFGLDPLEIQKGIENYTPSNNRSQITRIDSNIYLVDCYNANPSSMKLSLENFDAQNQTGKTLVLGDMLELGDNSQAEHQMVVEQIKNIKTEDVILIGTEFLKTECPKEFKRFESVDEFLLENNPKKWQNRFVLIKGSRGIRLEKIIA